MRTTNDVGKNIQMLQNIFKYININKQREASISFKHLQINTFFKTFLIPNFQSAGADLNTKKKEGKEWRETRADNTTRTTWYTEHAE